MLIRGHILEFYHMSTLIIKMILNNPTLILLKVEQSLLLPTQNIEVYLILYIIVQWGLICSQVFELMKKYIFLMISPKKVLLMSMWSMIFMHLYYLLLIKKVYYQEQNLNQQNILFFIINGILDLLLNKSKNFE